MKPHPQPSEQGAGTVEFAIAAIVLFTLIFGVITLAMAFYTYEVVNEYARDASRYAIVHGNNCYLPDTTSCSIGTGSTANNALKNYLNHEVYPGINAVNLGVSTTYTMRPGPTGTQCTVATCNGAGDQVTVTVSYPYLYAVPFIPQRSFTMNASSSMIISQ